MFEHVLLLDVVDAVEHGLVVEGSEACDDLHEQVQFRVVFVLVGRQDLQDVSVEVESVLEVRDLILQLEILSLQNRFLHPIFI